jgi:hypothetical protein
MALSKDVLVLRVGAEGTTEPLAAPLAASTTVYAGSIALLDDGVLKNSASPASTDIIAGIIGEPAGGTYVKTGPGIVNATTTDGAVWINCLTGTFLLNNGTGADELTEDDAGADVYVVDEITVGKTDGSATRPIAGQMLPIDPTVPTGKIPVKLAGMAGG